MTLMEFFGCTFIAFGPPAALFIITIARDPLRIIVLMASAFFWLISLLLSSLLWFAVVPLREKLAFGLVFSVLFQESFRLVFYFLLQKADEGLQKFTQADQSGGTSGLVTNKHLMAYVSGLGFGLISGAFSLVNVLADSTGPGTVGIFGHPDNFLIVSAFLTLCFILLHISWSIIFFSAMNKKTYAQAGLVVASHMLVSCLTLFNQGTNPVYYASVIPSYTMLVFVGGWAFFIAGGSFKGLVACFTCKKPNYNVD